MSRPATDESYLSWVATCNPRFPGEALSFEMVRGRYVQYDAPDDKKELMCFTGTTHGECSAWDGEIYHTTLVAASYFEMLTHLPLCSISQCTKVFVVGALDGSIFYELLKHNNVVQINFSLTELQLSVIFDEHCLDVLMKYSGSRIRAIMGDSTDFLKDAEGIYDAIIVDGVPTGPEQRLMNETFWEAVAGALRPGGVMCSRVESIWLPDGNIKVDVERNFKKFFKGLVKYAWCPIPAYPSGVVGFILCSTGNEGVNFEEPIREINVDTMKYYSSILCTWFKYCI